MNVSSCWSASRHMNSSFSLRRLGVMSLFISPRVRVCSGGSCVVMCSAIGTAPRCCSISSETSSSAGAEGHARERACHRDARRERGILVDRQRLLVAGDGQHIERGCLHHWAFRPKVIEVRVRVRNERFVGEEVHCFEIGQDALLIRRVEQHRQRRRRAEHHATDVRVVAVGIQPQIGQPVEQKVDRSAHLEPRQMHAETDVNPVSPADRDLGLHGRCRIGQGRGIVLLPVGRAQHRHHRTALRNRHPTEFGVPARDPRDMFSSGAPIAPPPRSPAECSDRSARTASS